MRARGAQDSRALKAYHEKAAAFGDEDAKAALKCAECPCPVKDKRGNVVSTFAS